ncbi:MAG TPA: hypothetical protein VJU61_19905 [Polyangiaceae bacterium]|nr:hypothetical protein [Polyangiaceae bacterium]
MGKFGFREALCALAVCFACGGPLKYQVASSPTAPGADAEIVADVNEDTKQTNLTVEVKNLPPAERVEESSQHYVAWYRKDSGAVWTRMAALAYEPDSREARMSGSVPELAFQFEITAEPEADAASPSSSVVFSQEVGD